MTEQIQTGRDKALPKSGLTDPAVVSVKRDYIDRIAKRLNIPDSVWEHDDKVVEMALQSWLGDI